MTYAIFGASTPICAWYVCWEVITVENQRLFRKCSCLQNKVKNLWLRTDSINSERTKLFIMFVDRGREQTYLGLNKLDQLKICILTYMLYRNWQYYVMCTETHLLIVWYSTYYVPQAHTRTLCLRRLSGTHHNSNYIEMIDMKVEW